ncbi:MAG: site-specific DNA-methyltransferase [Spirochaetales bacterium]|nr:site-specific DNA-methyltransferase [Spirochaetales bacterium]
MIDKIPGFYGQKSSPQLCYPSPPPPGGQPELLWAGKTAFARVRFCPARLKEIHGKPHKGWTNKIFWGDNLQVMGHLLRDYRGKIKLIYIDPPFDSQADYKKKIRLKGPGIGTASFEEKQYSDVWTKDEYLQFLYERLVVMRELLREDGSLVVHCDWHRNHFIKLILEEVFGSGSFVNEVVWCYSLGGKSKDFFARKHDSLFIYSKTDRFTFNGLDPRVVVKRKGNSHMKRGVDREGRSYREKTDRKSGKTYRYYEEEGKIPEDYWTDIEALNRDDRERENYPTQKPERLLERIISALTHRDDLVFDGFMGSGTTQAVAMKLGRRFIGSDINLSAVQTTVNRLLKAGEELVRESGEESFYRGFCLYDITRSESFRSPVQMKEMLLEELGLRRLRGKGIYDGERKGRLFKFMPLHRPAEKGDLSGLIDHLNYGRLGKRRENSAGDPVDRLTLVCMGHESDLKEFLESQVPYKLDVEILNFPVSRQGAAYTRKGGDIFVAGGELRIVSFRPENLLRKLNGDRGGDWRSLVESVMIDFNYDGFVLCPDLVDIPGKKGLVKGVYPVPEETGAIRVKITDLLSESLEITLPAQEEG